jgi:hypothetical protein
MLFLYPSLKYSRSPFPLISLQHHHNRHQCLYFPAYNTAWELIKKNFLFFYSFNFFSLFFWGSIKKSFYTFVGDIFLCLVSVSFLHDCNPFEIIWLVAQEGELLRSQQTTINIFNAFHTEINVFHHLKASFSLSFIILRNYCAMWFYCTCRIDFFLFCCGKKWNFYHSFIFFAGFYWKVVKRRELWY